MNNSSSPRLRRYFAFLAFSGLLCAASVHAKRVAMTDHEMSEVNAQGIFVLENSKYNGLDFSKIALNADVTLSANFQDILFGTNSGVSDINIPALQFGRSDGSTDSRLVKITNPYIQFVYNKPDNELTQVVGIRLGFDSISGDLGFKADTISGSMYVDGKGVAGFNNGILDATGKQWKGSNVPCTATCNTNYLNLAQLGGITAGNANGPSRDFWISALMSKVTFPPIAVGMDPQKEALPGYWLNFRDRLTALSAKLPPNIPLNKATGP